MTYISHIQLYYPFNWLYVPACRQAGIVHTPLTPSSHPQPPHQQPCHPFSDCPHPYSDPGSP